MSFEFVLCDVVGIFSPYLYFLSSSSSLTYKVILMDSNSTGGLLPGQSAPLTVITSTDQSGIVLIATALGLSFAIISLIIRIYIRLEFRHQFSRDDVVCALAMVRTSLLEG